MLELLAPAGSMESVQAKRRRAVYLGYGDFNARRNAKNFTREEAAAAVFTALRDTKVPILQGLSGAQRLGRFPSSTDPLEICSGPRCC